MTWRGLSQVSCHEDAGLESGCDVLSERPGERVDALEGRHEQVIMRQVGAHSTEQNKTIRMCSCDLFASTCR